MASRAASIGLLVASLGACTQAVQTVPPGKPSNQAPTRTSFVKSADASRLIYAVEEYSDSVTAYPLGANGNVSPALTIAGSNTNIYEPPGVAVAPTRQVAIANSNDNVTEYRAGASGNVAPVATITCGGPPKFPGNPDEIAFDAHGNLYVIYSLYHGAPSEAIEVYKPAEQSGCSKSHHILFGSRTGIPDTGGIAVANGMIYTANGGTVRAFHVTDNGNVAPAVLIQGAKTGLQFANGISLDKEGNIYVANSGDVRIFRHSANGNAAPTAVISGGNTQIPQNTAGATGIAVSKTGNIFVAVQNDTVNSILVFPPGANGNVPPIQVITGSNTGLSPVAELALQE